MLVAMMLTALLLLSLYTWQVHRDQGIAIAQINNLQAEMVSLHAQIEDLQILNSGLNEQLSERENQITLFANAMRVIALEGTEDAPAAKGTFYTGDVTSVLVLQGLPSLPSSQIYELWLIPSDGDPIPAGLARVEESGATTVNIDMTDKAHNFAAVGVSIEPAGGSPQPTGPIVLLGTVQIADSR
jgi:anti-sigma-K factor RskA